MMKRRTFFLTSLVPFLRKKDNPLAQVAAEHQKPRMSQVTPCSLCGSSEHAATFGLLRPRREDGIWWNGEGLTSWCPNRPVDWTFFEIC
jgi:hypothetical protein